MENFKDFLEKIQGQLEPILKKTIIKNVAKPFQQVAYHQIKSGGKRLRPSLAILSCLALSGKIEDVLEPSAGLEILHNYTLIVDDIIDKSLVRRNKPTVWLKYGQSIAQCIGIDYSASIFETAVNAPKASQISQIFSLALKRIVDGEIEDILFERSGRNDEPFVVAKRPKTISKERYLKMVGAKTASLFEASSWLGGVCAGAKPKEITALRNFGFNLGLAFQIQDDILDIFGQQKDFGKKIGKDIEERKGGNIILLLASEELNHSQENKIASVMKKKKIYYKDVKLATDLIKKTKARERAEALGQRHIAKAKDSLALLPNNQYKRYLLEIADYIMQRSK